MCVCLRIFLSSIVLVVGCTMIGGIYQVNQNSFRLLYEHHPENWFLNDSVH